MTGGPLPPASRLVATSPGWKTWLELMGAILKYRVRIPCSDSNKEAKRSRDDAKVHVKGRRGAGDSWQAEETWDPRVVVYTESGRLVMSTTGLYMTESSLASVWRSNNKCYAWLCQPRTISGSVIGLCVALVWSK